MSTSSPSVAGLSVTAVAEEFGVTHRDRPARPRALDRAGLGAPGARMSPSLGGGLLLEPGLGERDGTRTEGSGRSPGGAGAPPATDGAWCSTGAPRPPGWPRCCRSTAGSTSSRTATRWPHRLGAPGMTLHLVGGRLRRMRGPPWDATVRAMADLRVDVVVVGTNGISDGTA